MISLKSLRKWQCNLHLKIIILILAISVLVNFLRNRIPPGPPFSPLRKKELDSMAPGPLPAQSCLIFMASQPADRSFQRTLCADLRMSRKGIQHTGLVTQTSKISRKEVCHQCSLQWPWWTETTARWVVRAGCLLQDGGWMRGTWKGWTELRGCLSDELQKRRIRK